MHKFKNKRPLYVISTQNGHIIADICTFGWLNINCKFMKKVFLGNKKIWEIFLLLSDFIIIGVNGTQTIKFGMDENF